jgi:hypothetical protein
MTTMRTETELPTKPLTAVRCTKSTVVRLTPRTVDAICSRLAEGESLRSVCRDPAMPSKSRVLGQVAADPAFRAQYVRARELQADYWADQIIEIADDSTLDAVIGEDGRKRTDHDNIQRSRLRVDTRKWLMARMAPKKYGDRVVTEVVGAGDGPLRTSLTVEFVPPRAARD